MAIGGGANDKGGESMKISNLIRKNDIFLSLLFEKKIIFASIVKITGQKIIVINIFHTQLDRYICFHTPPPIYKDGEAANQPAFPAREVYQNGDQPPPGRKPGKFFEGVLP